MAQLRGDGARPGPGYGAVRRHNTPLGVVAARGVDMRHGIAGCALLCLFPACSDKVHERPCPIDSNSALYEVAETLCDGVDMHRLTLHRLTLRPLILRSLTLH